MQLAFVMILKCYGAICYYYYYYDYCYYSAIIFIQRRIQPCCLIVFENVRKSGRWSRVSDCLPKPGS